MNKNRTRIVLSRRPKSPGFILFLIAVWMGLIGTCEYILLNYEKTPGILADAPSQWPSGTSVARRPHTMTLLMFVHPHCPCTRASVSELALLMTHCHGKLDAHVFFLRPKNFSEDWAKTDIWKSIATIPGVQTHVDDEGLEAGRFKANTSGQVMLYAANGRLLFHGGITASRGHAGDNAGRSAIESFVLKGNAEKQQTSVFGCSLTGHRPTLFRRA